MPTQRQLRERLETLATILYRYGATFPVPELERYASGTLRFSFIAELPGSDTPQPATIRLAEIWEPVLATDASDYRRAEYAYDFVDHPRNRRRAFHGHDPDYFAHEFAVLVHEHCEETLGSPDCSHYFGLPVDAFEAIDAFTALWALGGSLGCADLRCMTGSRLAHACRQRPWRPRRGWASKRRASSLHS